MDVRPQQRTERHLQWFNKDPRKWKEDYIVGEEDITHIPIMKLIEIMGLNPQEMRDLTSVTELEDPEVIGGAYALTRLQAIKIKPYIHHHFDFQKYDYFIGEYAVE